MNFNMLRYLTCFVVNFFFPSNKKVVYMYMYVVLNNTYCYFTYFVVNLPIQLYAKWVRFFILNGLYMYIVI